MNFNNIEELKERLMPALSMQKDYFKRIGKNVSEEDIWNSLKGKWKDSKDLTLNEMVNDILKIKDIDR